MKNKLYNNWGIQSLKNDIFEDYKISSFNS